MSFDKCIYLWNQSHYPDIEHFHHSQKFLHATSRPVSSVPESGRD